MVDTRTFRKEGKQGGADRRISQLFPRDIDENGRLEVLRFCTNELVQFLCGSERRLANTGSYSVVIEKTR
jgi:hypothetical protein